MELNFLKWDIDYKNHFKKIIQTFTKKGTKIYKVQKDLIKSGSIIYYDEIANKVIDLKSAIEIMEHEYDLDAYNEEILTYKYVKNSLPIKKNITI